MTVQKQIQEYIATQPEPKRTESDLWQVFAFSCDPAHGRVSIGDNTIATLSMNASACYLAN